MSALQTFFDLVTRLSSSDLSRSENDLSSNLKNALTEPGMHGVLDTGSGTNRVKRPDVALYADLASADLGRAADVVVEAKKPEEVVSFPTLLDALVDDVLWNDKFVPYVSANLERVQFFILTTFEEMLVVPVTEELRHNIIDPTKMCTVATRTLAIPGTLPFNLRTGDREAFATWLRSNLTPDAITPPALSSIRNLRVLEGADDLERFAGVLADVVVGPEGHKSAGGTLVTSVRLDAVSMDDLPPAARSALMIYTMSAHGGMSPQDAERYLEGHLQEELSEFVSASIHSLIGRLFSVKTIEDCFCVGVTPPLISENRWVFHSSRFDSTARELLPEQFFAALAGLGDADNLAVRDLAATGRFYDWLAPQVDPTAFRRLLELFFSHSFAVLDGDLLGRFFEIYAQRVDRRLRRELGQYYTPMPIVRFMWRLALAIATEKNVAADLDVLDPSVGSGTFLIEGARQLNMVGIPRFWERLNGFDIAPQVIGVAQVNLYLTVLGLLHRKEAEEVGTLQLYPTDALDPRNGAHLKSLLNFFTDDGVLAFLRHRIDLSERVKRQSRFPLVIGNPPYKHNSNRTLSQMAAEFPPLLRSSSANSRAQENTIRDDYAWFFAAADHYLRDQGIIAFVVSDSFCYGQSFRYFREDLLRRYRIRHLVHLGRFIFRDVGPRTSFVIIILERLATEIGNAEDASPVPYLDLRPLAEGVDREDRELGTEKDPRLLAMDGGQVGEPSFHVPSRQRHFRLFPADASVSMVHRSSVPLVDSPRRVFIKKWPGAVTGFDKLLKSTEADVVHGRMRSLFDAAAVAGVRRAELLDALASDIRANEDEREKLADMVAQVEQRGLAFNPANIRRALTGSAPRSCAWYPDERMSKWIYYEPRITFERAVHEGRAKGWGTSNQWREPASHEISPKIVFTTTTNAEAGLKAFVLIDDWLVLKAAGMRQQLNYTGVNNPLAPSDLTGPNNLGGEAAEFYNDLIKRGHTDEDFLHYIAAIYNSALAGEFLVGGGGSAMHIPLAVEHLDADLVDGVIADAGRLRDVTQLRVAVQCDQAVPNDVAQRIGEEGAMIALGFDCRSGTGGRFKQDRIWHPTSSALDRLSTEEDDLQANINDAVMSLFEQLPTSAGAN